MNKSDFYIKELEIDRNSISSAKQLDEIYKAGEELERENEQKKNEFIQKQNEPILNKLNHLLDLEKEQNKKLQDQIDELKKANETNIKETQEAKNESKKSKMFGWISFGISTFVAIASLIVAIIALCI